MIYTKLVRKMLLKNVEGGIGFQNSEFRVQSFEHTSKSNIYATKTRRHEDTQSSKIWLSVLCESWCLRVFVAKSKFNNFRNWPKV